MSLENAREFAKLVIQNEGIATQVGAAIAGKTQPEAAEAVSALAASAGYEFTPEEGFAVSQEVTSGLQQPGSGPMSEQDLDAVAGGLTTTQTNVIATGVSVGVSQLGPAGAGGILGSMAGGAVQGGLNGDPNQSTTTNILLGAAQGADDFGKKLQNFFNSW